VKRRWVDALDGLRALCAPLVALSLLSACATGGGPDSPRVEAGGEVLVGEWLDAEAGLSVFRGVPYAAPPVGALRWRPPAPHLPRRGRVSATRFGPACPQLASNAQWYRDVAQGFGASPDVVPELTQIDEDCLVLNIWTGALGADEPAPVLVWIHGGGNRDGYAHEPNYLGHNLARRGVVVVSIQYRLGALGFLAHPALSAESERGVSGNYGILDQIAALRWVRRNVAAFGGDPERITAFGESAGGADIGTLIASPLARGLFRRAVIQSGGYQLNYAKRLPDEEAAGLRLQRALGIGSSEALSGLRATPWQQVVEVAQQTLPEHDWDAIVDGWLLPKPAASIFRAGEQGAVDLLIGSTANEWLMYLPDPVTRADLDAVLETHVRAEDQAELLSLLEEPDAEGLRPQLDRLYGAAEFYCPSLAMARAVRRSGERVYVYRFTRVRPGGERLLAYHGAEIPYVFDTADAWLPGDALDRRLTERMLGYWVHFARSGAPNGEGLPAWQSFDPQRENYQVLGDDVHPARGLDRELCRVLDRRRDERAAAHAG
jgi:para-nitrobenzyl esterase